MAKLESKYLGKYELFSMLVKFEDSNWIIEAKYCDDEVGTLEFWLQKAGYGISMMMFGVPADKKIMKNKKLSEFNQLLVLGNIEDYIYIYNDKYCDGE